MLTSSWVRVERGNLVQLGYCTNVHAGADLEATRANLARYAVAIREQFRPGEAIGIGLWLSASAAESLETTPGAVAEFAGWLAEHQLLPFTFNGFPFGDFHREVVKHDVYRPRWEEPARRDYTLRLVRLQHELLPSGLAGSISTVPLRWPEPPATTAEQAAAVQHLRDIAGELSRLERETGRLIQLAIEPEPGCELSLSTDVVTFFEQQLLGGVEGHLAAADAKLEASIRRHLGVCHDVCHAAVMFEDQAAVLDRYRSAGIAVPKVQVSSAVRLDLDQLAPVEQSNAIGQLAGFAEHRYLHQTVVRRAGESQFFEDLPLALAAAGLDTESLAAGKKVRLIPSSVRGQWRVHFHVPIYLWRFDSLATTQPQIEDCFAALAGWPDPQRPQHYEVETYAWGVLPSRLQQPDLAAGIAQELAWCRVKLQRHGLFATRDER